MKAELIDVSETQKHLVVEIPSVVVDAEIERVARDYSRAARIPGFRPGKVPARLVRQRFRDQILHDVAHGLIPRAVDDALRERGVEPVDTPDVRDVVVREGEPLRFTASFETVPPIDPGDYATITLRRRAVTVSEEDIDQALERLRTRAARYETVTGRGIEEGDSVLLDLERRAAAAAGPGEPERHEQVSIDIGAPANPPGFDAELLGLAPGEQKSFTLGYPDDYAIQELAGTRVDYSVSVGAIRRRVVPALDDELARDLGDFDSLEDLRARVTEDLRAEAAREAERELRADLLRQLAARVPFEVPVALVEREMDRRLDEFVRRLVEQQLDPRRMDIDWADLRERQREPAREAVRGAVVLDAIARREQLGAAGEDVEAEIAHYAERTGRTVPAVRARLEQEGGISRLYTGLRREKAIDFLLTRVTIISE